jgi:hypothetical protein
MQFLLLEFYQHFLGKMTGGQNHARTETFVSSTMSRAAIGTMALHSEVK